MQNLSIVSFLFPHSTHFTIPVSSQWKSSSGSGSVGERGRGDWACHRTIVPTGREEFYTVFSMHESEYIQVQHLSHVIFTYLFGVQKLTLIFYA